MQDVSIRLENKSGALAEMGACLGRAGISIEGGGAWITGDSSAAHFLFQDGNAARVALESVGIEVVDVRDVVVQRLKQAVAGQLGQLTHRMADAGINIEVLYSDHDHQLILVVDKPDAARAISAAWASES